MFIFNKKIFFGKIKGNTQIQNLIFSIYRSKFVHIFYYLYIYSCNTVNYKYNVTWKVCKYITFSVLHNLKSSGWKVFFYRFYSRMQYKFAVHNSSFYYVNHSTIFKLKRLQLLKGFNKNVRFVLTHGFFFSLEHPVNLDLCLLVWINVKIYQSSSFPTLRLSEM